jgi:hypothetical protein
MSDHCKIYVDANRPATLNNLAGALTDCATLQEAVLAWQRLSPEQNKRGCITDRGRLRPCAAVLTC